MRKRIAHILNTGLGRNLVLGLIILNAILLGMETYPTVEEKWKELLHAADWIILLLFTVEIFLRYYASGSVRAYLKDPWNVFDFLVVGVCWLPFGSRYVSVARILRVLRVLRAMSIFPDLRQLVVTLLRSLPSMAHIALLLVILIYTYAVVGTFIFREVAPGQFGSLHRTALTLFQVVTLEGWNEVMEAVLPAHPWAWIYFLTFIFIGTFVVFNLFVGVIVNNLQTERSRDHSSTPGFERRVLKELQELRKKSVRIRP